ncbi:O-antigen ligase family protein [Psychroserpens sp. XS_ASV72]|uniref:O-antigen ligase family protein n=1 Tax=Psychroserpens sp. XS_ASV72 TaxID=3241293 RepID=UPI0035184B19
MKIRLDSVYKVVFASSIIIPPLIFSIEVNILLMILVSTFIFMNIRYKYSNNFLNIIAPLVAIFLLSIFSSFFYPSKILDIIKDFFFLAKPFLFILMGYYLISKIEDKKFIFKAIIYIAFFFAIIHISQVLYFLTDNDFNVNKVRNFAGRGNVVEIFAVVLLFSKKGRELYTLKSKYRKTIIAIILMSFIFYFSRTATVAAIILLLSINGYLAITRKGLIYMTAFFTAVLLFYAYLFSTDLERGADGLEGFLYKVKIAPSEIFSSEINIEDHSDLWDHWRAYEAKKAFEQLADTPMGFGLVCGKGVGSLVDLEFVAPLNAEGIQYITTIHNGYAYIAYKAGLLGVLAFLVFLLTLYLQVYIRTENRQAIIINNLLSGIAIYYMFTTLIVSGIYNPRDYGGIILGGIIYLSYFYNTQQSKLTTT